MSNTMWHLEIIEDDSDDGYGNGELRYYIYLHREGADKYYDIYREWRSAEPEYHWPVTKMEDMTYNVDVDAKKLYVTVNGSSFEYELASYKQCSTFWNPGGIQSQERIIF